MTKNEAMEKLRAIIVHRTGILPSEVTEDLDWERASINPSTLADIIDRDLNPSLKMKIGIREMANCGTVGQLAAWMAGERP